MEFFFIYCVAINAFLKLKGRVCIEMRADQDDVYFSVLSVPI